MTDVEISSTSRSTSSVFIERPIRASLNMVMTAVFARPQISLARASSFSIVAGDVSVSGQEAALSSCDEGAPSGPLPSRVSIHTSRVDC